MFLILFSEIYMKEDVFLVEKMVMRELKITKKHFCSAFEKTRPIFKEKELLDKYLAEVSREFSIERIGLVELTILRMSLYEYFYQKLPKNVTISEAIRLAKKFSSPESGDFVNAILEDAFAEKHPFPLPSSTPDTSDEI